MDPAKWFPKSPELHGEAVPAAPQGSSANQPLTIAERFYGREPEPKPAAAAGRPLTMEERFYGRQPEAKAVSEAVQASPGGPPDTYQPFKVPAELRHLGLTHDEEGFKTFSTTAKELGLSQDAAQRLVDLHLHRTYGKKK